MTGECDCCGKQMPTETEIRDGRLQAMQSRDDEIRRLQEALTEIRDHWACQYDHPIMQSKMYAGPYGIGVTDGHRAAATIARAALKTAEETKP